MQTHSRRRSATLIAVIDAFLGLASQAITARRSAAGQATSRNDLIVEHVDTINASRGATMADSLGRKSEVSDQSSHH